MFKKVKSLLTECRVKEVVLDFEKATWNAIKEVFPDVGIHGCAFHWAQAVYRRVQHLGLANAYSKQPAVQSFIRKLMSLPYLPAAQINNAFTKLLPHIPATGNELLLELTEYLNKNWISSSSRPPTTWSSFRRSIRTNNDVEAWHHSLNTRLLHNHPNMYILISTLHKEAATIPLQRKLIAEKKLYRQQKKSTTIRQKTLQELWTKYDARDLTTYDFLDIYSMKCVGHLE